METFRQLIVNHRTSRHTPDPDENYASSEGEGHDLQICENVKLYILFNIAMDINFRVPHPNLTLKQLTSRYD